MALSLTVIPSVLLAQKSATEHTIRANEAVKTGNRISNHRLKDHRRCQPGLYLASIDGNAALAKEGKVSYSVEEWDFLKSNAPQTANPSLWRQSQLNRINGLFEVIPDKLYQVRGFDIANMTFIRSDNGWIIIDVTTTDAAAKAGYDLIKKHVADLPVQGVIFTHPLWRPLRRYRCGEGGFIETGFRHHRSQRLHGLGTKLKTCWPEWL